MPIKIEELKDSDVGQWVNYKRWQIGRIKSWNNTFVFVVYKCNEEWDRYQDFTGVATKPEDLTFVHGKRGKIIDVLAGHVGR